MRLFYKIVGWWRNENETILWVDRNADDNHLDGKNVLDKPCSIPIGVPTSAWESGP